MRFGISVFPICRVAAAVLLLVFLPGSMWAQATVSVRVSTGNDDAEQRSSNGEMYLDSTDLELAYDFDYAYSDTVGMRFQSINIPQNATISNAYIQFKVDETSSGSVNLTIRGQAIDNAPTFTTTSNNITSRNKTTASVSWSPAAWNSVGATGTDQRTPNIASVIQEIVNRSGWASGNSIVIIITGTGTRTAEAYEGDSAGAPLLHIEYAPQPNIYYVRTDGNDSNSGTGSTAGQAWQTLREATRKDVLEPGDIIYVKPGTYTERMQPDEDGSLGLPIRVIGDRYGSVSGWNAGEVIIQHNAEKVLELDGDDYWSFENFTIVGKSDRESIKVKSSEGIVLKNLTIYSGKEGIHVDDARLTVLNCIARDQADHGLRVKNSNSVVTVYHSVFAHNGQDGVFLKDGVLDVKNSIIAYNSDDGFDRNNGTLTHTYNIVYSNSGGNFEGASLSTGELTSNPLFTSASSRDYTLQIGSPALNSGTSSVSSVVSEDILAVSRPIGPGWDRGAYEYTIIGQWEFNSGVGATAVDSSGNGQTGTIYGGAGWEAARCSYAVKLNGSSEWVDFGQTNLGTKNYTFSGWFKTSAGAQQTIIAATAADSNNHVFYVGLESSGNVQFVHRSPAASSGGTTLSSSATYRDGLWHHVAAIKSSSELKLYVDGELVDQTANTTSVPSSVDIVMGRHGKSLGQRYFHGALDQAVLYGTALSASQIADILGLVGRWRLDDTSGSTAMDSSPLGNHGIYRNGVNLGEDGPSSGLLAAEFDGYNDYVQLPAYTTDFSKGFSVSVWSRPTASNSWARFIDLGGGEDLDNLLFSRFGTSTTLCFTIHDGSLGGAQRLNQTNAIVNYNWNHYAATVDAGGSAKLFINGVQVASGTVGTPSVAVRNSNFIARSNWSVDGYYKGKMYDVRIYKRALCADELEDIYQSGRNKGIRIIKWVEVK